MNLAEIIRDTKETYSGLALGKFEDTKVIYKGLYSEHKISVWEEQTGMPVSSRRMLEDVDFQAPIWRLVENSEEMNDEDEEGNLLYATKMGLLGFACYALRHPVMFIQDCKGFTDGWMPSEDMMEQYHAKKDGVEE